MNNFLDISKVSKTSLRSIIEEAKTIKAKRQGLRNGDLDSESSLRGCIVGLLFEKPSTRTRVSFDVGVRQMGGQSLMLSALDLHLGDGESVSDTAKVLSRYLDMLMIRTFDERLLLEFAANSKIPVINGLTDQSHPCQVMADIMTFEELRGSIFEKKITWVGDGNNVCSSYIHAAIKFGFNLTIASPKELMPPKSVLKWAKEQGRTINLLRDPKLAVKNADLVVTDTHASMHNDISKSKFKLKELSCFQVNNELMECAKSDGIFLHCLPAHRNIEVTDEVIDGPKSAVFEAAENRLHVQKAIMKWCI